MAASKKTKQHAAKRKQSAAKKQLAPKSLQVAHASAKQRVASFLQRRPHRSFRMTRRRDYVRSLDMPGYWTFTLQVLRVVWRNRRPLLVIVLLYATLSAVLLGLGSQESFTTLRETLDETSADLLSGNWGEIGKAILLAITTASGGIAPQLTEAQQVYNAVLAVLAWLTIIWFLRQKLAGKKVTVRDALYNSGAPIVPTGAIVLVGVLQLLPVAIAAIGYTAAQASGLLDGGVEAMLFWAAAAGLVLVSLYWVVGTALALVVVTLPGVYPLRALAIAGDMVVGRRLRILLRLGWMVLLMVVTWLVVLLVCILIDAGLKSLIPAIAWLPIVPVVALLLTVSSLVVTTTYVYLLYRRIVEDDSKPA